VFSIVGRYRRAVPIWRQVLQFVALISLTAAVIELVGGRILLEDADFARKLYVIPRLAKVGFILTFVSLVTCLFGNPRSLICILPSSLIVAFLFFAAVAAL
jgi:hypothetical protein